MLFVLFVDLSLVSNLVAARVDDLHSYLYDVDAMATYTFY